jgi:nuclear transport factor 2 (NTF2) superfamily protein
MMTTSQILSALPFTREAAILKVPVAEHSWDRDHLSATLVAF